jgi:cysteine desulfurase / selenocysteine lyase
MKSFNLARSRAETPGCEKVLHLNNAGAALMPQAVLTAQINHLKLEAEVGGYEAAERSIGVIDHVYDAIARLIACQRDEVAVVENATRAWDMAFYAIPFKSGDRILTTGAEYASNYIAFLQTAKRTGAKIEVVPNDEYGQVSIHALREMIDDRVKLISITHVPTNGGLVNPAAEVGAVAREAGVFYLLDACQSVGQMPIDVNRIGCDMLSGTGRKYLRGPRATGFLYVRRGLIAELDPPFLDLHAAEWSESERYVVRRDARRFENWETNYAGKIGLGVAIDYSLDWGLDAIWARIAPLAEQLRVGLKQLPGITIHDLGKVQCGIVSFTCSGRDSHEVRQALLARGVNVWVSAPGSTRIDSQARSLGDLIRASVHYYNTEEEIERFCGLIGSLN